MYNYIFGEYIIFEKEFTKKICRMFKSYALLRKKISKTRYLENMKMNWQIFAVLPLSGESRHYISLNSRAKMHPVRRTEDKDKRKDVKDKE